ncbi:hypothetical protein [Methanobacterium sp. ACI-7]|uniref:hypothetical protein n=1 Tax=unclassified Methanobacterium TaxID=2627676 RepID=UPI0039C4D668
MISPKVYQKQIEDLGIEGKKIFPQSTHDAHIIFEELKYIEKVLDHIRYNIRMDTRAIRKEYIKKLNEVDLNSSKNKIKQKRNLIEERDLKISQYESIIYTIDHYLKQIKDAKSYVLNFSQNHPGKDSLI